MRADAPDPRVERMNEALRAACERVRELLAQVSKDETLGRYRIGAVVADVKRARDTYGTGAVGKIARAVGQEEPTLYRYATVAECWSESQLQSVLRPTTARGQPLSWSHLVVLAAVPSKRRRAELIERAIDDDLSVRELKAMAEERGAGAARSSAQVLVERYVRTVERWSREADAIQSELLAELETEPLDGAEAPAVLERAIAAQQQLHDATQQRLQQLRAERVRLEQQDGLHDPPRLLFGFVAR